MELDAKLETASKRPTLYKPGRIAGTREIALQAHCVSVYRVAGDVVELLRVLHAAQPPAQA